MPIETIEYKGVSYPALQGSGHASRFATAFAKEFCKGAGLDIGANRMEWCFPGANPIDPEIDSRWDAYNLPDAPNSEGWDYVHSSHCYEHLRDYKAAIKYLLTKIKKGGIIFLYLPNCEYQKYWAFGNDKHIHFLSPSILRGFCEHLDGISKFIVTDGYDLNGSFYCVIEK